VVNCSWGGFIFYIFGFVFFSLGVILTLPVLISHIYFGIKKGFFYNYDKKVRYSNPLTNIIFFGFMVIIGIYAVYTDIYPKVKLFFEACS